MAGTVGFAGVRRRDVDRGAGVREDDPFAPFARGVVGEELGNGTAEAFLGDSGPDDCSSSNFRLLLSATDDSPVLELSLIKIC